jgi:predicted phosphodiesterase
MRVAVLSDIHANLVALDAVLAGLQALGRIDAVWHLGDVVGYGPDPDGVVERLQAVDALGVRGNHDSAAIGALDTEWFNHDARTAVEWTRDRIRPATRAWLQAQPTERTETGFALVHGSYRDPTWEYVTQASVARANLELLPDRDARHGLFGHTHLPSAFRAEGGEARPIRPGDGTSLELDERPTLVNPGSVGQPRDGIPAASCLLLDTDTDTVIWHRFAYDIGSVQAAMRSVGLPERLAARLSFGL